MLKKKMKTFLFIAVGGTVLVAAIAGIVVWQVVDWDKKDTDAQFEPEFESELGVFTQAAIATDAPYCSDIAKTIFQKGGNVIDAAIAALVCVGIIQNQSMGLGGGFFAVYYNATTKTAKTLNARDRAPLDATENMFDGNPDASARGPLSVAVPGELKGYWELWKEHGSRNVTWKELFEPTILLAENGWNLTAHAANAINQNRERILNTPSLREVFFNNQTGDIFKTGELIQRPVLAATLRQIADAEEGDLLYRDTEMMRKFVEDIRNEGGILKEQDMLNYNVTWDPPVEMKIAGNFTIHSFPPPGSGILVAFFMKLLSNYSMNPNETVTFQRITEAFKHGYAKRTLLGDPEDADVAEQVKELYKNLTSTDYINEIMELIHDDSTNNTYEYYGAEYWQPEDHGTSTMSLVAPNGDAIAVTSTVNLYFGSMLRSRQTGIIYNDMMDDFSSPNITNAFGVPPSVNNFIKPGKRPVSSMTPTIFTDSEGKVRLVIGGAGGTQITTSVTLVAIRNLWFGENIKEAIDARRMHHQLYPMELECEAGFSSSVVEGLKAVGHVVKQPENFIVGGSVVQAIAIAENGTIYANSDFRKKGTVAGY
ncbi:Gamma-glutamyltranspeptidase 1 [Orchesella cincta]|uniref:Gamma-glutamyltranspeptidase 1 n=1 Tax=Orchesella cincta TaxID=48709 RepID=A0A1D2NFN3_ORCCI|nr:Gamma-glutamyltranspeptidase 1 [Orchesella cincta]